MHDGRLVVSSARMQKNVTLLLWASTLVFSGTLVHLMSQFI